MGISTEQWRAMIGRWLGGTTGKIVTLQHCYDQSSHHISYHQIRFLVLASLLIIGCVELNPGPDQNSASPQTAGAPATFHKRPGATGEEGVKYEKKMASFLFARALHKTEEFFLASNMDGAGAFDDLVFRYRLTEPDVWKTCFIQLKHKKEGATIKCSELKKINADFSLFKYFESYCQIKSKASTDPNLIQCGPFDDFEFVIYTNARMEVDCTLQGNISDPVSILSSVKDNWQYINFDENKDKSIFGFFEELSRYDDHVRKKGIPLKGDTFVDELIESVQKSFTDQEILDRRNSVIPMLNKDDVKSLIKEIGKCDFTLYKEFLKKVKIFQGQSNEKSLKQLIQIELRNACTASWSVANSIYTMFEEGFSEWCEKDGNIGWLNKDSKLWHNIENDLVKRVNKISEPELQEIVACDIRFNQQHLESLCDAIKHNSYLNIATSSNTRNLQKLKTHQALNILGYTNYLFIGLNSLKTRLSDSKLWPCKWSAVLVIDCDCEDNVADILLDILRETADSAQSSDSCNDNEVATLLGILQKYQLKVILISTQQHRQFATSFEDNCNMLDLDEMSQNKILERTVDFQGNGVALQTLVGTNPPECIKHLIDCDVMSILLSKEHKLRVGRQLSDLCKYYVPRLLQHHIYLKEDIFKLTDNTITFAVSGLQADELKKYLPDSEKIYELQYDEREGNHHFEIVPDFSKIGLSAEWGAMKSCENVVKKMKYDVAKSLILGNKNTERDISENIENSAVRTDDNLTKSDLSAELENMKGDDKIEKKIKPEEVRYIILGDKNPNSKFRDLIKLLENVHWIHAEEGSLLWRESSCNIDIIRRYIDTTKCIRYDMERVMEQSDRTMLLVAEPGMGKSTFLSHIEDEIKKRNPAAWVLRINLSEHISALDETEFKEEDIDQCKMFLWNAAHLKEHGSLAMTKEIFLQALDKTGKMIIILDGFDEISPNYTEQVNTLLRAIRDKTASLILVASRFSYRQNLEDIWIKLAFTLQPFTQENQIEFLERYWKCERQNEGNLRMFAEKLLSLCSQNFSDKDGKFTGIPLQTMMLGEAFMTEAAEYCLNEELKLPEKFNLHDLFNKFWKKKCDIFFSEKNKMDTSLPMVIREKESCFGYHMFAALISLFSLSEENELREAIKDTDLQKANEFLEIDKLEKFGMITEMTDGKPHFIHRCFAEYFAANWFTGNFSKCVNFISNNLFKSTYEVTRNIFDQMLAEDSEIHGAVFKNDIEAVEEYLRKDKNINFTDKGGRTALHLAASYNSPITQKLLPNQVVDVNKPDAVLKWTPLRYADRTKSWMAMDTLLQNGANADDIVLTRRKIEAQEWGQRALWESASQGYRHLLEFMLNCGTDVNAVIEVPENTEEKNSLLHIASVYGKLEVINLLVQRGADINIPNAK